MLTTGGLMYKDMGSNKAMWTEAFLEDDGRCHGYTRTATFTWFGGFTGAMTLLVLGPDMTLLDHAPRQTFGVDGRWLGNSDRTDHWEFLLDPERHIRATTLFPLHEWASTCWRAPWQIGQVIPAALLT